MKSKLVSLDKLKTMFGDNTPDRPVIIHQNCCDCGCEVEIEIHKTSGGFGLQGGIFLERDGQTAANCLKCYEKHTVATV